MQNGPKWCKSSCQEVVLEFFATNVPIHPIEPKLMFDIVSYYFCAFGTILLCYKTQCKTGPKWCKSSCHEVVSEFFATNAPDPPFWTITSCFAAFHTIWVHLGQFVALQHSVRNEPNLCKSSCHEVASQFFITNAPDPPHLTLNSTFVAFRSDWLRLGLFCYDSKLRANGLNWSN